MMMTFKALLVELFLATAALGVAQAARFDGPGPYTFDYLLGENTNFNSSRQVLFVDYVSASESVIRSLKAAGKTVICYVNVGGWEEYRSDANQFPASVLGNEMDGWPDEKWLDIRQLDVLLPIMNARFQLAASKGCEGVDPDNMQGYTEDTGFPLTRAHQLAYNRAIMRAIRSTGGMMAGQKNVPELSSSLVSEADFVVIEECHIWTECDDYSPYVTAGKPAFAVEYIEYISEAEFLRYACAEGQQLRFSFILKKLELHADYIVPCIAKRSAATATASAAALGRPRRRRTNRPHASRP